MGESAGYSQITLTRSTLLRQQNNYRLMPSHLHSRAMSGYAAQSRHKRYRKPYKGFTPYVRSRGYSVHAPAIVLPRFDALSRGVRSGGFLNLENKFLDTNLAATAITTSWSMLNPTAGGCVDSLSVPAIGDTEQSRDGRIYFIRSIHFRGVLNTPAVESNTEPLRSYYVRMIMYMDTQTNGDEASPGDLMKTTLGNSINNFRNLAQTKRFRVLWDKRVKITQNGQTNEGAINLFSAPETETLVRFDKKFKKPIKCRSVGTTANVSSAADYNIGMAFITTSTTQANTIAYECRVRFSD